MISQLKTDMKNGLESLLNIEKIMDHNNNDHIKCKICSLKELILVKIELEHTKDRIQNLAKERETMVQKSKINKSVICELVNSLEKQKKELSSLEKEKEDLINDLQKEIIAHKKDVIAFKQLEDLIEEKWNESDKLMKQSWNHREEQMKRAWEDREALMNEAWKDWTNKTAIMKHEIAR